MAYLFPDTKPPPAGATKSAAASGLLVFGSLLFVPFTEEYAREVVPREHWNSPRFKAVNRRLTILWGRVFAVMTVSHVIAGSSTTKEPTSSSIG